MPFNFWFSITNAEKVQRNAKCNLLFYLPSSALDQDGSKKKCRHIFFFLKLQIFLESIDFPNYCTVCAHNLIAFVCSSHIVQHIPRTADLANTQDDQSPSFLKKMIYRLTLIYRLIVTCLL